MDLIHRSPVQQSTDLLDESINGFVACDKEFLEIDVNDNEHIISTNGGLEQVVSKPYVTDPRLCKDCFSEPL